LKKRKKKKERTKKKHLIQKTDLVEVDLSCDLAFAATSFSRIRFRPKKCNRLHGCQILLDKIYQKGKNIT
jgi:hypothetical protein